MRDASVDERVSDAGRAAADGGKRSERMRPAAANSELPEHTGSAGPSLHADADADAGASDDDAGMSVPFEDPKTFAAGLSGLFIDMPCDPSTAVPLPQYSACSHAPNTQHVEKVVTFRGQPGALYNVTLRARAIWEPTNVGGGEQPYPGVPFTIGGEVAINPDGTNAIDYQQFSIRVAAPQQTYWLNNYQYTQHEIHKDDYQFSMTVAAGAEITLVVNDGNDLEIANFDQLMFADVPPYNTMPSLGQSLRLDVVAVDVKR